MTNSLNNPDCFTRLFGDQTRVAVITGGVSGIGLAAAELFLSAGFEVVAADINVELGEHLTATLNLDARDSHSFRGDCSQGNSSQGNGPRGKFSFIKLDVRSAEQCNEAIATLYHRTRRIDVLFNSAGLSRRDAQMDEEAKRLLWDVNVCGTENMCNAVIPYMKRGSFGRIINMGSVVGYNHIPFPVGLLYKQSKEWIHKYSLKLGLELAMSGITVNALAPGRVLTDLVLKPGAGWVALAPDPIEAFRNGCSSQRSGTMLLPQEVAAMALFLTSPLMSHVNASIIDMSDGWGTAGHQAWDADSMPEEFYSFRELAQATTSTRITA